MGYFFYNKNKDDIDYSPGIFESFGNVIGGVMGGIADLIGNGIMVFLILGCVGLILYFAGAFMLGEVGIIKANFNVTMAPATVVEEASIITISHQKKPKVVITPVSADGITSFETSSTKSQSVFLSYDGMLYDHGAYIIPGLFGDTNIECSLEPSRAVLVTFLDANGKKVTPESLEITDGAANAIGCTNLGEGIFAFLLPEDTSDMALTFRVPGNEPVTVNQNWNNDRLSELEVRLNG